MYIILSDSRAMYHFRKGGSNIANKTERNHGMEEHFKRAVTEMLVLTLLSREDLPAVQIMQRVEDETEHTIGLVSPYMLFYRLIEDGCIIEAYKKPAPDGRRRQYYQISEDGRRYLADLVALYHRLTNGVASLLGGEIKSNGE